jgi:YggT family protein
VALALLRYLVFAAVALAVLGALAAMAVQRRVIDPFGPAARGIRRATDPLLHPFERRILRAGGNPQSAPWWLIGTTLVLGILGITAAQWIVGEALLLRSAAAGGSTTLFAVLVDWAFGLLMLALLVRVIGSWIGIGSSTWWMRPAHVATEWFLAPLRRVLPPFGPFDLSPLVAWFLLSLLRGAVTRAL